MTQAPATPSLVERLKGLLVEEDRMHPLGCATWIEEVCVTVEEAADALEAQQARIAELEEVLAPFAKAFRTLSSRWEDTDTVWQTALSRPISVGQLRAVNQALSSQGRHEGGEDGLQELPGVNAVPLPASPDGPSQMYRVWAAVNVLGAPDTACTSDEDRAYCRAIGDALSEIEKLGGRPQ